MRITKENQKNLKIEGKKESYEMKTVFSLSV